MFQILLAILYCTAVCHAWGYLGISLIAGTGGQLPRINFSLTCIFGLAILGILSQLLSIAIPMGGWMIQGIIVLPIALLIAWKRRELLQEWRSFLSNLRTMHVVAQLFLAIGLIYVLVVGIWTISNPDTLGYHAPIIKWNQEYKAIQGIANLNGRLGLQSSWFILCALFNFSFLGATAISFINSTLLCWLIIFLAERINFIFRDEAHTGHNAMLWYTLCLICFGVPVQVYLAASSASPDFITCIFLWACFYLLLQDYPPGSGNIQVLMAFVLLAFSATLKLSVLPALLLVPYCFYRLYTIPPALRFTWFAFILSLALLPFLYRNYLISGYPLFPASYLNLFQPDWQVDPEMARTIDAYVTVYARVGNVTLADFPASGSLTFREWFPLWLAQYTWGEILLTFTAITAMVINCLMAREFLKKKNHAIGWIFLICMISSIYLMRKAPSPRFAQAFLVPPILITIHLVLGKWPFLLPGKWIRRIALTMIIASICYYAGFRFQHYFEPANFWKVNGITTTKLITTTCNGVDIHLPLDSLGCGNATLPCANNACETFLPRGKTIEAGFKAAK